MAGFNKNKKKTRKYPNLESAIRPVAHSEELPVLFSIVLFTILPDIKEARDISLPDDTAMSSDNSCSDYGEPSYVSQQLNQSEFNGLVFVFQLRLRTLPFKIPV